MLKMDVPENYQTNKSSKQMPNIEYTIPADDIWLIRDTKSVTVIILIGLFSILGLLALLGIVVEYTSLGNVKLSHEDTNFTNIDIPVISDGNSTEQLNQILMVKDELLMNSKSLWATIVLCFSLTRNIRHLFYKYKPQPERIKHRNCMYFIWIVGFIWLICFQTLELGIRLFPQNIWTLPDDLTHWTYAIFHGGQLFGFNMVYYAWGYIIAVSLLNY
jgi:hypothetical protein